MPPGSLPAQAHCNVATWALAVHRLPPSLVRDHVTPLLAAALHAIDNPFASCCCAIEGLKVRPPAHTLGRAAQRASPTIPCSRALTR